MVNASDLLDRIRADIGAKRYRVTDLAREAGLPPTTVYSMIEPDWSNRAVSNVEALAAALERITSRTETKASPRQRASA
ncbi:MAG: hypothetical protein ACRCU1_05160 [Alsobacter sp.]